MPVAGEETRSGWYMSWGVLMNTRVWRLPPRYGGSRNRPWPKKLVQAQKLDPSGMMLAVGLIANLVTRRCVEKCWLFGRIYCALFIARGSKNFDTMRQSSINRNHGRIHYPNSNWLTGTALKRRAMRLGVHFEVDELSFACEAQRLNWNDLQPSR